MPRKTYGISTHTFSRRLESKRQHKRAKFRECIGVRFEADPDSCNLPHIYLPRLHRQKTKKDQHTKLGEALIKMAEDNGISDHLSSPHQHLSAVQREVREFTDWILPYLRKNVSEIDFKRPVVIDSFTPWKALEKVIPCLLPFTLRKTTLKPLGPGYVFIQLPRRDLDGMDEFLNLRSDDRLHLSPKKTYQLFNKILRKAFHAMSIPLERLRMVVEDDHFCLYYELRNYGWTLEIIPAIHISKSGAVLVSKSFNIDDNPSSEMRWTICWGQKEAEIIRSISCTDMGLRVKVLHIVCKLCQRDWRLNTLTPYQIQTALLFDMDYHIDHSPRWQRCTIEECVLSLLERLLHFAKLGYLPHFLIDGFDLFKLVPQKSVILYKSALERLATNEKALISLLQRTQPEREPETQWMEHKYERITRPHGQIPAITGIV